MREQQTTTTTLHSEKELGHIGESRGGNNHDHDMIHELGKRLDAVWKLDQYIANADADSNLLELWTDLKKQEKANVRRLKEMVAVHCEKGCFGAQIQGRASMRHALKP
jgi:hypothetical protein